MEENNLQGKTMIEYACGEGACGVILSELGCIYHGVDISPSAIAKYKELLKNYPTQIAIAGCNLRVRKRIDSD